MIHTRPRHTPAQTVDVEDYRTCDLCGDRITRFAYDVDEVEVGRSVGTRYPEGSQIQRTELDMCGECFDTKLVPWLESQGATLRILDQDF